MVDQSERSLSADARYAVHLSHLEPDKRRHRTLCERPIGLGDDAVLPYDVVTEAQAQTVDCPVCLERAGNKIRRWRSPRRKSTR